VGEEKKCACLKGKRLREIKAAMETHRKWQTGRQRGGEKERRTGGIRVSLLMFVSESPQARPLRSSATRPHFTMSYSLSLSIYPVLSLQILHFLFFLFICSLSSISLFFSRDEPLQWQIRKKTVQCDMSSYFSPPPLFSLIACPFLPLSSIQNPSLRILFLLTSFTSSCVVQRLISFSWQWQH